MPPRRHSRRIPHCPPNTPVSPRNDQKLLIIPPACRLAAILLVRAAERIYPVSPVAPVLLLPHRQPPCQPASQPTTPQPCCRQPSNNPSSTPMLHHINTTTLRPPRKHAPLAPTSSASVVPYLPRACVTFSKSLRCHLACPCVACRSITSSHSQQNRSRSDHSKNFLFFSKNSLAYRPRTPAPRYICHAMLCRSTCTCSSPVHDWERRGCVRGASPPREVLQSGHAKRITHDGASCCALPPGKRLQCRDRAIEQSDSCLRILHALQKQIRCRVAKFALRLPAV